MFKVLGGLCIAFGIVDIVSANFLDYDITGFQYSPFIAFIVGYLLMKVGGGGGDDGGE